MTELPRHPRTSIYTAPSAHALPCKSISGLGLNFGGQLFCRFGMDASSCQFLHGARALETREVAEELGEHGLACTVGGCMEVAGLHGVSSHRVGASPPAGPRDRGLWLERDVSSGGDGGSAYGDAYLSPGSFRFGGKSRQTARFRRASTKMFRSIRLGGLALSIGSQALVPRPLTFFFCQFQSILISTVLSYLSKMWPFPPIFKANVHMGHG
jgi:hypothetical protein